MLDNWTITDASDRWDFRVTVESDTDVRPESEADVYSADTMAALYKSDKNVTREESEQMADWARRAVRAWELDLWRYAMVTVIPVLRGHGVEFTEARASLGRCDYGWLPGTTDDDKGTWTNERDYVRTAWVNDLIGEAMARAEEELNKIKEGREQKIADMAATIAEHTAASPASARAAALAITEVGKG